MAVFIYFQPEEGPTFKRGPPIYSNNNFTWFIFNIDYASNHLLVFSEFFFRTVRIHVACGRKFTKATATTTMSQINMAGSSWLSNGKVFRKTETGLLWDKFRALSSRNLVTRFEVELTTTHSPRVRTTYETKLCHDIVFLKHITYI